MSHKWQDTVLCAYFTKVLQRCEDAAALPKYVFGRLPCDYNQWQEHLNADVRVFSFIDLPIHGMRMMDTGDQPDVLFTKVEFDTLRGVRMNDSQVCVAMLFNDRVYCSIFDVQVGPRP